VPDDNLETYLETHDANGNFAVPGSALSLGNGIINDDYITTSKIAVVTQLNVFMQNIYDLTGIEDFIALTNLNCDNNHLTILDVSQNSALEHLQFNNNQISNLDVSNNLLLNFLSCKNNSLTILDVSNNSNLQILFCSNNQISNLNINTNLEVLNASGNQITNLSLDLNPQIMELNLSNNPLTALSFYKMVIM
jgi:Leucine-rich repeat (LRR) protein